MLRLLAYITVFFCMFTSDSIYAVSGTSKLNWMTNFDNALVKAKREKKYVLLFFTGSDWCGWCHRLENEALDTTDFSDAIGGQFIFVVVDFPLKTSLDATITAQNKELQQKYNVIGFPTIILLDENGQKIGSTGYQPGGGKSYADHLKKLVEDYKGYRQKVSKMNSLKMEVKELEALYGKANELCRTEDAEKIVKCGIQNKDNHFFLIEKYRLLADSGKLEDQEAQAIKKKIFLTDSSNLEKIHYEVAVIEFEALSKNMDKDEYTPERVIAPLLAYIERFGEDNSDHSWQLHMIIAQVYLDKQKQKEALKYAKISHSLAPESRQLDIQKFIVNLQK